MLAKPAARRLKPFRQVQTAAQCARVFDWCGTALRKSTLTPNLTPNLCNGFEGKLTSSKWATLAKCSPDTALRDIENLMKRAILVKDAAGGRSTSYSLADIDQ